MSENEGGASAAGAPAGGAGGADGQTAGYCPEGEPCRICPLGDSITEGFTIDGGYRIELFRLAVEDGYDITFVGTRSNGPDEVAGKPFPKDHEGTSGITIADLDTVVQGWPADIDPNIILLHVGTNDMRLGPDGAPNRLGTFIDHIIERAPEALLVVSTIIPYPDRDTEVDEYNAAIPGVVEQRAQSGAHIMLADQFTGFPESELEDGVHPGEAGYARMAGVWYEAISEYLQ